MWRRRGEIGRTKKCPVVGLSEVAHSTQHTGPAFFEDAISQAADGGERGHLHKGWTE